MLKKRLKKNNFTNIFYIHKKISKLIEESIGYDVLEKVITHLLLQGKPFILETPNDDAGYARKIEWVLSKMRG